MFIRNFEGKIISYDIEQFSYIQLWKIQYNIQLNNMDITEKIRYYLDNKVIII